MFLRVITTLLVLFGVTAGGYGIVKYEASKNEATPPPTTAAVLSNAWIEVEQGTVFRRSVGQGTPLHSGDFVNEGDTLETAKNTNAIVHFPDGSVLRLDKETSITLNNFSYSSGDKSLVVEIQLLSGRLWSKVVGLATPASQWQVKTSNTVATVRGTAFGMGFKNNKSWILGSEHTVSVVPLDPTTKEPLPTAEIAISENAYIEIGEKEVLLARATSSPVLASKVSTTSSPLDQDIWIKKVRADDVKFNTEIEHLKESQTNKNEQVWRSALEEQVAKELYKIAPKSEQGQTAEKTRSIPTTISTDTKPPKPAASTQDSSTSSSTKEITTSSNEKNQQPATLGGSGVPTELQTLKEQLPNQVLSTNLAVTVTTKDGATPTIQTASDYPIAYMAIREGTTLLTKVRLTATGGSSDPTDVTAQTTFGVAGSIGSISKEGIFTAKLGDDVSENGVSYGAITVMYKNGSTGNTLVSRSILLQVSAVSVTTPPTDIGGQ